MASKQQKFEALKTAIEIAKEYARSAAEGYPTGVMKVIQSDYCNC